MTHKTEPARQAAFLNIPKEGEKRVGGWAYRRRKRRLQPVRPWCATDAKAGAFAYDDHRVLGLLGFEEGGTLRLRRYADTSPPTRRHVSPSAPLKKVRP